MQGPFYKPGWHVPFVKAFDSVAKRIEESQREDAEEIAALKRERHALMDEVMNLQRENAELSLIIRAAKVPWPEEISE